MIKRINFKKRMMGWYKIEFLGDYLRLFWIHSIYLFEFIFLGGMTLKMKKFIIQWRKFELKRIYINEVMNFLIFQNFLDFILIFQDLFHLKKSKKGLFNRARPAEVTWRDADMWQDHASPHDGNSDIGRSRLNRALG